MRWFMLTKTRLFIWEKKQKLKHNKTSFLGFSYFLKILKQFLQLDHLIKQKSLISEACAPFSLQKVDFINSFFSFRPSTPFIWVFICCWLICSTVKQWQKHKRKKWAPSFHTTLWYIYDPTQVKCWFLISDISTWVWPKRFILSLLNLWPFLT